MLRIAAAIITLLLISALAAIVMGDAGPRKPGVSVSVEKGRDASVRLTYELKHPTNALAFREVEGGYREMRWKPLSPDFVIRRSDGLDRVERRDGAQFTNIGLVAQTNIIRIEKNYQPLAAYGEDGLLLYTGHFWPVIDADRRMDAVFSFASAPGGQAVVFGERAADIENWRSPMAHPAFVYLGPLAPVETKDVLALVDPTAPVWVRDEVERLTPAVFEKLAELFGFSLDAKPNLFLAAPLGSDPGRLAYSGDALPGQVQITLEGGGWAEPSERAQAIFRRATIHEAVHLWQSAARPAVREEAPWIHEGAADAIAAETMVALGLWNGADYDRHIAETRAECAARLRDGPLETAADRKDFRALYACGHVIAVALSRADDAPAGDFWRAFIDQARAQGGGYTKTHYYNLVRVRTDNPAFVQSLRVFVRTPHANPGREIDRLFAAAREPIASSGAR